MKRRFANLLCILVAAATLAACGGEPILYGGCSRDEWFERLEGGRPPERLEAARALGALLRREQWPKGAAARRIARSLRRSLDDPDPWMRAAAASGLAWQGSASDRVMEILSKIHFKNRIDTNMFEKTSPRPSSEYVFTFLDIK